MGVFSEEDVHQENSMGKKKKKSEPLQVSPEEEKELESIIDRLSVQDPEGESFSRFVESLSKRFEEERLRAALLERISKAPTPASLEVFKHFRNTISEKPYVKVVKRAEFRLKQKGINLDPETKSSGSTEKRVLIDIPNEDVCAGEAMVHLDSGTGWDGLIFLFEPSLTYDAGLVFVEESATKSTLGCYWVWNSKRKVLEMLNEITKHADLYRVPMYHGAVIFNDYLEIFEGRYDPGDRTKIFEVKRLLAPHVPENRDQYFLEVLADVEPEDPQVVIRKLTENKSYFRLGYHNDSLDLLNNVLTLLKSPIESPAHAKRYRVEKVIDEFFENADPRRLKLLGLNLKAHAVKFIHDQEKSIARTIYDIAKHCEEGSISPIRNFLISYTINALIKMDEELAEMLGELFPEMSEAKERDLVDEEGLPGYRRLDSGLIVPSD